MADFPKAANGIIAEEGELGAFFHARFQWVPRVGELIDLYSFLDASQKRPDARHFYVVVAVVHEMHDVFEGGWWPVLVDSVG